MRSLLICLSTLICACSLILRFYQLNFIANKTSEEFQSPNDLSDIISFYVSNGSNLQNAPKNQKIAFGYAGDLDIVVNAMDLMKSLGENIPPKPISHQSLANKQDFLETFAHFFQKGSGVEYFIENEHDFQELVEKSIPLAKIQDLGGNGAVMALRAFQEGVDVLLGCSLDEKSYKELFDSKISLVSPLMKNMTDIHLVLDFFEGEQWGNLVCPRSNRFYLNHDIFNTDLKLLNPFHEHIKRFEPKIVAIGGLHLFNDFPEEKVEEVFGLVRNHLIIDKEKAKIHLEMGSFSNEVIMHSLIQKLFPHIQSIGLNEQELSFLVNYFQYYGNGKIQYGSSSRYSINDLLANLVSFVSFIKNKELPLERIQFHSLNLHSICYKTEFWQSPFVALKKTVLVALQTCKHENSHIPLDDFEFNPKEMEVYLNSDLLLKTLGDTTVSQTFNPANPYNCWDLDSEWQCCYTVTPNWISPNRTRGLGDNISSTGLIYHKIKK